MYFGDRDQYADLISKSVWSVSAAETWASFALVLIILETIVVLGNGHLIGFHIFMKCKGLTTYEWIMERREKLHAKEIAAQRDSHIEIEIPSTSNAPSRDTPEKNEDD